MTKANLQVFVENMVVKLRSWIWNVFELLLSQVRTQVQIPEEMRSHFGLKILYLTVTASKVKTK